MKQHKLVPTVLAFLISGQAFALEQYDNTEAASLTEITLQHNFVAQFKHFDEPRFFSQQMVVRSDAQRLTNDMNVNAEIIARDEDEAVLVSDTYHRLGATIPFAMSIKPDAQVVTIKFFPIVACPEDLSKGEIIIELNPKSVAQLNNDPHLRGQLLDCTRRADGGAGGIVSVVGPDHASVDSVVAILVNHSFDASGDIDGKLLGVEVRVEPNVRRIKRYSLVN